MLAYQTAPRPTTMARLRAHSLPGGGISALHVGISMRSRSPSVVPPPRCPTPPGRHLGGVPPPQPGELCRRAPSTDTRSPQAPGTASRRWTFASRTSPTPGARGRAWCSRGCTGSRGAGSARPRCRWTGPRRGTCSSPTRAGGTAGATAAPCACSSAPTPGPCCPAAGARSAASPGPGGHRRVPRRGHGAARGLQRHRAWHLWAAASLPWSRLPGTASLPAGASPSRPGAGVGPWEPGNLRSWERPWQLERPAGVRASPGPRGLAELGSPWKLKSLQEL